MTFSEETDRATMMLLGKTVKQVFRHSENEVMIEFDDGSRFFADSEGKIELSITLPHESPNDG